MSAYVSSFVYCDTVQTQMTTNGPQNQIVSPLQALTPIAIPGNFSFSMSINIAGFDLKKEHHVEVLFVNPDGSECAKPVDFNFNLSRENAGTDAKSSGITINIDIRNVVLPMEGLYISKVSMDSELLGEYKIEVQKQ